MPRRFPKLSCSCARKPVSVSAHNCCACSGVVVHTSATASPVRQQRQRSLRGKALVGHVLVRRAARSRARSQRPGRSHACAPVRPAARRRRPRRASARWRARCRRQRRIARPPHTFPPRAHSPWPGSGCAPPPAFERASKRHGKLAVVEHVAQRRQCALLGHRARPGRNPRAAKRGCARSAWPARALPIRPSRSSISRLP